MRIRSVQLWRSGKSILLQNANTDCSVQLQGLSIAVIGDLPGDIDNHSLPLRTLEPSGPVPGLGSGVIELSPVAPLGVEIKIPSFDLDWSKPGYIALCDGNCDREDGSNVLDLVAVGGPFALPPPVTFSDPLTLITDPDENQKTYFHFGFDAVAPDFLASDWRVGGCNPDACPSCPVLNTTLPGCCTELGDCGCLSTTAGCATP